MRDTNAERQQRYRDNQKKNGLTSTKVPLSEEELELCHQCYERAFDPGNTFTEFLRKSLVRGVVFVANTGSGSHLKKINGRYAVTYGKAKGKDESDT